MKILAISDPHGEFEKVKAFPVKDVDLILIAGDLGSANLMREIAFEDVEREKKGLPKKEISPTQRKKIFMEAYDSTIKIVKYLSKHAPVYIVYGNVESTNQDTRKESKEIGLPLPFLTDTLNEMEGVKVINNKVVTFNGIKIGGLQYFVDTNWVRDFKPKNYAIQLNKAKRDAGKAKEVLRRFGKVDILVTHQPPYRVLDKVTSKFAPKDWQGKNAGSKTIRDYIVSKQPRYVFCGHIHEGKGVKKIGKTKVHNLGFCGYKIISI